MSNIIECRSVSFSYNEGNNKTSVLKNLNFEIKSGETTQLLVNQDVENQRYLI